MNNQREIVEKVDPINKKVTKFLEEMEPLLPDNPFKNNFFDKMKEAHLWANESVIAELVLKPNKGRLING